MKALGVDGKWQEILNWLDDSKLLKPSLDALLTAIRDAHLPEEDKKIIRMKVERKIPYLSLDELEIAEKILEIVK